MSRESLTSVIVMVMVGLATAGCGSDVETYDTEYVEGVVTMDGKPVPGATVTFVPAEKDKGTSAVGVTDENGVYKLNAMNVGGKKGEAGGGTTPGEYLVGVLKSESETFISEQEAHEKGIKYVPPTPGKAPKVTHVVPQKYNDPRQSGLKATVNEGENNIPIELSSK